MTTNYDQVLETCLPPAHNCRIDDQKYLLHRTGEVYGRPLYHIHGIAGRRRNNTICIGYEHYMGYVQKLRSRLIEDLGRHEVARHVAYLMLGLDRASDTWEDLFFSSDIAIVGLGLGYEEADLWELITLRAAVLYTGDRMRWALHTIQGFRANRIVYYDVECDCMIVAGSGGGDVIIDDHYQHADRFKAGKYQALRNLGVEVRVAHVSSSVRDDAQFVEGYKAILDELIRDCV